MNLNIDEILESWENDSKIDETALGEASSNVSRLHSKYISLLAKARYHKRKCEVKALEVKADKVRYYKGVMTREELQARGWNQYQGPKILKGEMMELIESDPDFIIVMNSYRSIEIIEQSLESIVKEIFNRSYHIKSCLDWQKWTNGE